MNKPLVPMAATLRLLLMSERQLMSLMLGKMGLKELAWFGVNFCMRVVIDFPVKKSKHKLINNS